MARETLTNIDLRDEAISHLDALWQTAHWFVDNENDAETLITNTYVEAFRSGNGSGFRANCKIRMFQILANMLLGDVRPNLNAGDSANFDNAYESISSDKYSVIPTIPNEIVIGAIKSLRTELRLAMVLSIFGKFTYAEISEIMGVRLRVVRLNICWAYALIRRHFFEYVEAGNKTCQLDECG